MIWSSRTGKIAVLLASVGAHGLAGYLWWANPEVLIEGGSPGTVQARLGNSFADMSAGTLAPETPDTSESVTADQPVEPTETQDVARTEQPPTTETTKATPIEQSRPEPLEAPSERQVAPQLPIEATPPATALPLAPSTTTALRAAPQVITAQPAQPTQTVRAPEPETLQALEDDNVQVSPRPQLRPQRIERQAEQRRQQPDPQPRRQAQPGNSQQNAVAGSETGSNQATATRQSSNTGQSAAAGNAAVSNYPGQVMRRISRVPRPRVGSRGTAVVSFTIAASGGLSGLSIARSSGNAQLDQAALRMIRRAAPFPRPPAGARRSYQISIQGRG